MCVEDLTVFLAEKHHDHHRQLLLSDCRLVELCGS